MVQLQIQAFQLQTLLNKIEREFDPQADAKGLSYRSRETNLLVRSDPTLLELILRNLVSNAIHYTERGGLQAAARARRARSLGDTYLSACFKLFADSQLLSDSTVQDSHRRQAGVKPGMQQHTQRPAGTAAPDFANRQGG